VAPNIPINGGDSHGYTNGYTFPTDRDGRPNPCKSPADTRHSEHRPERAKKRNKAGWWLLFLSIHPQNNEGVIRNGIPLWEFLRVTHWKAPYFGVLLKSAFNPHSGTAKKYNPFFNPQLILILEPDKNPHSSSNPHSGTWPNPMVYLSSHVWRPHHVLSSSSSQFVLASY